MGGQEDDNPVGEERSTNNRQGSASSEWCVRVIASSSKALFTLAVVGSALTAVTLFISGFFLSLITIVEMFVAWSAGADVLVEILSTSIKVIDTFLVATVFYVISLGLYELFIARAPLPGWVEIRTLDDLKTKLLGVVVIALAVLFLGEAVTWRDEASILHFGLGIGALIVAISVYLWVKR
ncbi:YqhA family protein [Methanofollis formosanus]|nr:YqhA family protein [Methanofollis formosanus]